MTLDYFKIVRLAVVVTLLSGCVGAEPVPEDRFYRLPLAEPANTHVAPLLAGTLGILDFRANSLLRERAILYIRENSPLEIQRYHYHFWSESPPDLVRDHLRNFLVNAKVAPEVDRLQRRRQTDFLLGGRVLKFERYMATDGIWVRISIELNLERTDSDEVLVSRVFDRTLKVEGGSMHRTVESFGGGLEAIYREFVEELATAL